MPHPLLHGAWSLRSIRVLADNVCVQYETPSEHVRGLFEEHGDIKTFFDLISTRGMVFVTYVSFFRVALH